MLSLTNKTGSKSSSKVKGQTALAWHVDFRQTEALPDTKTVRTQFFVNATALFVAASLILFIGLREWKVASLGNDIDDMNAQIAKVEASSAQVVKNFHVFQVQEKRFKDAYAVVGGIFSMPDFLIELGALLPPGTKIRRIEYRGEKNGLTLVGTVEGLDADASDRASAFVQKLKDDKGLAKYFANITLASLGRNMSEGVLNFELNCSFPVVAAPKPAAKK